MLKALFDWWDEAFDCRLHVFELIHPVYDHLIQVTSGQRLSGNGHVVVEFSDRGCKRVLTEEGGGREE